MENNRKHPGQKKGPRAPKKRVETHHPETSWYQRITRGQIVKALAAIGVFTVAGLQLNRTEKSSPTAQQISPAPAPETLEQENQHIAAIEKAFQQFAKTIHEKAPGHTPPQFLQELDIPAMALEENRDNKTKNFEAAKLSMKRESEAHFYYAFYNPLPSFAGAAYSNASRTISLRTDFNVNNPEHLFILYHELIHAKKDEERKQTLPEYGKTLSLTATFREPIAFLSDEVRANAITLMAMNAYFDGALEKLGEKATDQDIRALFSQHIDTNSISNDFFSIIKAQTNIFYNSKASEEIRTKVFEEFIRTLYGGVKLYKIAPDGSPIPLTLD